MPKTTRRTSFSLPSELVSELDTVARIAGVTRSALLTELLSDRLHTLFDLVQSVGATTENGIRSRQQANQDHKARQRLNSLLAAIGMDDDAPIQ